MLNGSSSAIAMNVAWWEVFERENGNAEDRIYLAESPTELKEARDDVDAFESARDEVHVELRRQCVSEFGPAFEEFVYDW